MSLFVFWAAVFVVAYTYVGYPLVLAARARVARRAYRSADITPRLSLIVCAHNEAASIRAKLENVLSLDYPRDRLEVLIASDGSSDATNDIVAEFAERGVRLLALPRRGKIPTLNAAVREVGGEVLVFSDANSLYAPGSLRALVRPFADATVGGVAGDQRYLGSSEPEDAAGERAYWDLDRRLKEWQSAAGSATSATGAIYAIRRDVFRPVEPGVTDDFFVSTAVVAQGLRLVFAADAIAYEPPAASSGLEFERKVRVLTRGLRGVLVRRALLDPFHYGFYSLQLLSHKVLRRLVALPLLALLVSSLWLWNAGPLYQLALAGQLSVYGLAALAWLFGGRVAAARPFAIPLYFCMVNLAALRALGNVLRGRRIESWEPRREPAEAPGVVRSAADAG